MRTMFDAIYPLNLPTGADLYAGYIGGSWPDAAAISLRFPHTTVVRIAVQASEDDGVVLDVEAGDATPAQAVDWVLGRRRAGVDPTVYCNTSTWPAVRAAFEARGVPLPHWWAAAYVQDPSTPPTVLSAGAVALQWYDFGGYDASIVADYWPGVDPAPTTPAAPAAALEEDDMSTPATDGYATLTWSTGTRHVVQVAYDTIGGNSPDLRVVLLLGTGPLVLAESWKPTASARTIEFTAHQDAAYGIELQPVGAPARYAVTVS